MAESTADNGAAAPTSQAPAQRSRPIKTLPTERIQFSKQLDLLRAYAAASGPTNKPVTNKEVAEIVKMVESTVSISNAFFTDVGFVSRTAAGFVPSGDLIAYQRAYEWNPETASQKLAPTLRSTWFGERLATRLSFKPMDEEEAIQVLAEAAAATKEYRKQVMTLLDYLNSAGIIQRENGIVRSGPMASASAGQSSPEPQPQQEATVPANPSSSIPMPRGAGVVTGFAAPMEGVVQFHVSVRVDMGEFKGWAPERITAFFGGIAAVLAAKGKVEEASSGS